MISWLKPPSSPALWGILTLNLGIFVLIQLIMYNQGTLALLWLTKPGLLNLLIGQFIHFSLLHILFNLIALTSFSSPVLARLGEGRFLALYLASGLAGSILHFLFSPVAAIGASGAVSGIFCFFAAYNPHRHYNLLLFFIIPLRMSGRTIVIAFFAVNAIGGISGAGHISFLGHIGGGLVGTVLALRLLRRESRWRN